MKVERKEVYHLELSAPEYHAMRMLAQCSVGPLSTMAQTTRPSQMPELRVVFSSPSCESPPPTAARSSFSIATIWCKPKRK